MADFCNQCAKDIGFPPGDLAANEPDANGRYHALCEGCGPTVVDAKGNCLHIPCNEEPKGPRLPKDAIFYIPLPKPAHTSAHYKGHVIEPIDIIDIWELDFNEGNIVKYLYRAKHGNTNNVEKDLEKLVVYAEWLLAQHRRRKEPC